MNLYRVTVDLNPEKKPDVDTYEFFVDRESDYASLAEYLDRLQAAHIVDSWDGEPVSADTSVSLDWLKQQHGDELEDIESGYEQAYSDDGGADSDPVYRSQMQDAGRGHLLR